MLYESGQAKQMTQRCEPRPAKSSGAQALGLAQVRAAGVWPKLLAAFPGRLYGVVPVQV
jgi:hypothetical protein